MADEVLVLDACVGVSECAALWLEDGADTLVGHDHVEPNKEAVVRHVLQGGEVSTEACVKRGGIGTACFVERDERVG